MTGTLVLLNPLGAGVSTPRKATAAHLDRERLAYVLVVAFISYHRRARPVPILWFPDRCAWDDFFWLSDLYCTKWKGCVKGKKTAAYLSLQGCWVLLHLKGESPSDCQCPANYSAMLPLAWMQIATSVSKSTRLKTQRLSLCNWFPASWGMAATRGIASQVRCVNDNGTLSSLLPRFVICMIIVTIDEYLSWSGQSVVWEWTVTTWVHSFMTN